MNTADERAHVNLQGDSEVLVAVAGVAFTSFLSLSLNLIRSSLLSI